MPPKKSTGKRTIADKLESLKSNPFEKRSNLKQKHTIVGRRVKGENRNVAAARLKAVEKRKKTLLQEYKNRGKSNAFNDRRFGEKEEGNWSVEDKLFARFQEERKRKVRNSARFNLAEEPAPEELLTHGGRVIDDYQDADGDRASSDEEDFKANAIITEKLHFGGGAREEGREADEPDRRSHKDIMAEVVAKSKLHKAQRQQLKDERDDLTEALDSNFASIQGLLNFRPKKNERSETREAPDDYDKLTRALAFEAKARASNRTLTPEEEAQKEREELEELEKKRLRRMQGLDSDSEEETTKSKKRKRGPATDDDLNDDYALDNVEEEEEADDDDDEALDSGSEEEEEEEEDDEEEGSGEEVDTRLKGLGAGNHEEDAGDDEEDTDNGSDIENDEEVVLPVKKGYKVDAEQEEGEEETAKPQRQRGPVEEIPYIFPCPSALGELLALFGTYSKKPEDDLTIISRIRKCHSIHLGAENQKKMHSFFKVLLELFFHLCDESEPTEERKKEINEMTKVLWDLAKEMPEVAAKSFRSRLEAIQLQFYQDVKKSKQQDGDGNGDSSALSSWPSIPSLLFLRLLPNIFPSSDFRHSVVSPAELLLCQILIQSSIHGVRDIAYGLYCCELMLQYTAENKRFTPEVLHFLLIAFGHLLGMPRDIVLAGSVTSEKRARERIRKRLEAYKEQNVEPLKVWNFPSIKDNDAELASAVVALTKVVRVACSQWEVLPAAPEMFRPLRSMLGKMVKDITPSSLIVRQSLRKCFETVDAVVTKAEESRSPLQLQTVKPVAIPTLDPKFEETYSFKKDTDPNKERARAKQLARQVKREKKGAVRELKRDATFLAKAKQEDERKAVEAKKEKQKEIWSWLQEQQASVNEQVKKGGGLLTGGGSNVKKRPRVSKS